MNKATTKLVLLAALLATPNFSCSSAPARPESDESAKQTAQAAPTGYRLPPEDVVRIVDAPPAPSFLLAPGGRKALLAHRNSLPSIEDLAQPMLRLAGIRINPDRNERRTTRYYNRFQLQDVHTGAVTELDVPADSRLGRPLWSPDGTHFAFTRSVDAGVELWLGHTDGGSCERIVEARINNTMGSAARWDSGSSALLVRLIPEDRGDAPVASLVGSGPIVQETSGRAAVNRTYQDLLTSPHDERLFEHYFTSQLARVDLSGAVTEIGKPGIFMSAESSPDGSRVLVNRLHGPYSYSVPYWRFAHDLEIWKRSGELEHTLASLPLADDVPIGGVSTGPRSVEWYPHQSATLVWAEAQDGGDPKREADFRDELFALSAPFEREKWSQGKIVQRYRGAEWTTSDGPFLVTEYDRDRRWTTTTLRYWDSVDMGAQVVFDRSIRDVYGDPGSPVTRTLSHGANVIDLDEGWILLSGAGASAEGERPFVDRFHLTSLVTDRIFESPADKHTSFVGFAGDDYVSETPGIFRRESATEPPNYFRYSGGDWEALTAFEDPHPELTGITKELLTYERADGVPLSATLYLPPGYEPGTRLPVVVWAYPVEYNDAQTAGQVRSTTNRFTRLASTSPLMFLTQGYAVLDRTAMPVVGTAESMNDNFAEQIVTAAEAAIAAGVERGVVDPNRVGVAGHSYGAFMTANLLAHCDLFQAGIARSGAYNRSLTPFGFQAERRTLWETPETYVAISPFFQADQVDEPLLLIHGEVDNNSGTFPLQSRRMFHALQGLGGTARYVRLPHESHGYSSRESVLHVLAESFDWFDEHVKNAPVDVEAE